MCTTTVRFQKARKSDSRFTPVSHKTAMEKKKHLKHEVVFFSGGMRMQGRRRTTATTGIQISCEIHLIILFTTFWDLLYFKASNISLPAVCVALHHFFHLQDHYQRCKEAVPSGSARMHLVPHFYLTNLFRTDSLSGD